MLNDFIATIQILPPANDNDKQRYLAKKKGSTIDVEIVKNISFSTNLMGELSENDQVTTNYSFLLV